MSDGVFGPQEQKRTSKELKCAVDDMRKMMHNSLKVL